VRELKDAIDDYLESKARYISAAESYNSLLNQAAKDNVEKTKSEYLAANERLISEIS
jgi:vacuolar-type H+-ATPase subunit H